MKNPFLALKRQRKIVVFLLILCLSVLAMPQSRLQAAAASEFQSPAAKKPLINNAVSKEARLIVHARYEEIDDYRSVKKVTDGVETSTWQTHIVATLDAAQKEDYYITVDGEDFKMAENPERSQSGSYQGTYNMKLIGPKTKPIFANGAAGGEIYKDEGIVSADWHARGLSIGLQFNYPNVRSQCSGDFGGLDASRACLSLPENGSGASINITGVHPDLPPQAADEDPNITLQRTINSNPAFWDNNWYGAKTTKQKNGYKVTFQKIAEDPFAKEQTESSTPDEKIIHTHTKSLSVTALIIIGPAPAATMEIEPEKTADYDNWMPVPGSDDDQKIADLYGDSQTVAFKVSFKSKDPKKPAPAGPMSFYLQDVSRHKGRCGNEPKDAESETDLPDLRFSKNQPGGIKVDSSDPQHAFIADDVTEAIVYVEATDAGAYGKLTARSDELGLVAVYKRTNKNFVPVPRDDNDNHVADAWEKQNEIFVKNYPATWDEEDTPQNHNKGDGLTLYEEYRGFVADIEVPGNRLRKWQRFPSKQKKLFVNAVGDDKELYRKGALGFEKAAGIKVYFIALDDDLKFSGELPPEGFPNVPPRWLNFNSDTDDGIDFGSRQYAVNIRPMVDAEVSTQTATTPSLVGLDPFDPAAPEQTVGIYVKRKNIEFLIADDRKELPKDQPQKIKSVYFAAIEKIKRERGITIDINTVADYMNTRYDDLVSRMITFSVIHELGHATGMLHHTTQKYVDEIKASLQRFNKKDFGELPKNEINRLKAMLEFRNGDENCPMLYWYDENAHADSLLLFWSGNWNPAETTPSGKPWKHDNETDCMKSCRLHKDK